MAPALTQDGGERPGAAVAKLTDLVDTSGWPEGTRLVVRREPLRPGARHSLLPSLQFRYWGHWTDAEGDPVDLNVHMRAHAHVEDHIRRLKDSGLERFPFADLEANRAWFATVCFADALVRWFQSSGRRTVVCFVTTPRYRETTRNLRIKSPLTFVS